MKSLSKSSASEKFNKFIQECSEFSKSINSEENIIKSFPRFILKLYFNMNKEDIEEALSGLGSNDDGVDAFFINEDEKKYYLIQFKSRKHFDEKESKDGKKEWFNMLSTFTSRVKDSNFKTKNLRIKDISSLLKNDLSGYSEELYLFHLGETSNNVENNFNEINYFSQKQILNKFVQFYEADLSDDFAPDEVELEINSQYEKKYQNEHNFIYFTLKTNNKKERKTLIFPINGAQIVALINQGTTILERNVRGYLGDTNVVNKGIIETALQNPDCFYFYNNGISITCDSLTVNGITKNNPKIKLVKPQIINGAQTVNSLKSAFDRKLKELKNKKFDNYEEEAINYMKNIHVVCKIMESNKILNSNFSKDVTKFSNTQNKIKPTDFFSNRPEQIVIKEEMLKYDITYNIKRGKNFEFKEGLFVDMENLAENHLAQTEEPFFAKATQIFVDNCENSDTSNYSRIFGNNGIHNSKRTMELVKTFFISHFLGNIFNHVKKTINEIETLIGKSQNEIDNFENLNKDVFKITSSKIYFQDIVKGKSNPFINPVIKYLFVMDFKTLSYISREIIENHNVQNSNDEFKKMNLLIEDLINKKNYSQIENLIKIVAKQSLDVYSKFIKEIFKDKEIQKRHPKTKEAKEILRQKISEFLSEDNIPKFEF